MSLQARELMELFSVSFKIFDIPRAISSGSSGSTASPTPADLVILHQSKKLECNTEGQRKDTQIVY